MENELLDSGIDENEASGQKIRVYAAWGALLLAGILFNVMHWPGHGLMTILSLAGLFAYALCGRVFKDLRSPLNRTVALLGAMWIVILGIGVVIFKEYPFTVRWLLGWLTMTFALFGVYCFYHYFTRKEDKEEGR